MSIIVGIFIFIHRENFMLIWVEHENGFVTLGPGCLCNKEHSLFAMATVFTRSIWTDIPEQTV